MIKKTYQNWQLEIDTDAILWLTLDQKSSHINTLNHPVIEEFNKIIDSIIEQQKEIQGIILKSGKSNGFIAGADIQEFIHVKNKTAATDISRSVQSIFDKWERLHIPTVAMIDGFCLGGGLELALACHYRVASSDTNTYLAAPEVKLGIHPGFGGTVRLVHLLGVFKAMSLMLTGRSLSAKTAEKFGLVDIAVPQRVLHNAAISYIHKKPYQQQPALWLTLLEAKIFRPWICRYFYAQLSKKIKKTHYPAPYVIVNRWGKDGALGINAMVNEAKSIGRLFFTHTSQELVRLFFLKQRLKAFGKKTHHTIKHVHVIGAGTMGAGIATQCLLQGLTVSLQEPNKEHLSKAIRQIYSEINRTAKKNHYLKQALQDALFPDLHGNEISKADIVIEAIFEDLSAKQTLFKQIESKLKPGAILATNTSTIPLSSIASVLKDPNQLVGIHFFNPPTKMPLIEVVRGDETQQEVVDAALAFVIQINRLPLPVKSAPGFLVNRLLMPYLLEGMLMVEEGYSPKAIDKLAENFGMPIGPLALIDKIGLDICLSAAKILAEFIGSDIPDILIRKVKKGKLGLKTQKGFYTYNKEGKIIHPIQFKRYPSLPGDSKDRLILPMLIEGINCLKAKIIPDADLLDAGIVFGTGFAPFRGGIIQYVITQGVEKEINILKTLEENYGARFKVDPDWKKILQEAGVTI